MPGPALNTVYGGSTSDESRRHGAIDHERDLAKAFALPELSEH
jgi:hypothetical protein